MAAAGQRDKRIVIERQQTKRDALNAIVKTGWLPFASPWARVRYGAASDQRAAAQAQESQIATFAVPYSAKLLSVTTNDRILYAGAIWGIKGIAPARQLGEISITATTSSAAT